LYLYFLINLILNIFIMSPEDIMYYSRPSSDLLNIERASRIPSFPVIPWAQPKGRLHCFIHEDGQPCHRPATSFISSKRIKKLLAKSNLKLISKSEASHVYVCNMHKKQLDSERSDINSEDANNEETITGYSLIRACFDRMAPRAIRRYKKANNLSTDPASTRDEILDILAKHALSSPVNEKECIAHLIQLQDILLFSCMLLHTCTMNFMFTLMKIFALLSYNFSVLEAEFGNFRGLCIDDVMENYSIISMKLSHGTCISLNELRSNDFFSSCYPGSLLDSNYFRKERLLMRLNDKIIDFVEAFGKKEIAFPAYIMQFPFSRPISQLNLEEHVKVSVMPYYATKAEYYDYSCEKNLEDIICTPDQYAPAVPVINVTSLYEAQKKFFVEKIADSEETARIATYFEIVLKNDSHLSSLGIDVKINHIYESIFNVSYVICMTYFMDNCVFFDRELKVCTYCKPNFMGELCTKEIVHDRLISCNTLDCGATGQCFEKDGYSVCICTSSYDDMYQKLFWILVAVVAVGVFWLAFTRQKKKELKGPESKSPQASSSKAEETKSPANATAVV
ncbi:Histone deacetylase complex subunit SAP30 -like protein, partial [Trichinella sp. T6]